MKKALFLVAVLALVAAPTLANGPRRGGSDDTLKVNNSIVVDNYDLAIVDNDVDTKADTGDNGVYHNSGDVSLTTGKATAISDVFNQVNYINTYIELDDNCGCLPGGDYDEVKLDNSIYVGNHKTAFVDNDVDTKADTGDNKVAGNGGSFDVSLSVFSMSNSGRDKGHRGRRGGDEGGFEMSSLNSSLSFPMGGDVTVRTGEAQSGSYVENVVNTDITTIKRGVVEDGLPI